MTVAAPSSDALASYGAWVLRGIRGKGGGAGLGLGALVLSSLSSPFRRNCSRGPPYSGRGCPWVRLSY